HRRPARSTDAWRERQIQHDDRAKDFDRRSTTRGLAAVAKLDAHRVRSRPERSGWRFRSHNETSCRIAHARANRARNGETTDVRDHVIQYCREWYLCCPVWARCELAILCNRLAAATNPLLDRLPSILLHRILLPA